MERTALSRIQRLQQSAALDFCVLFGLLCAACTNARISRGPITAVPPFPAVHSTALPAGGAGTQAPEQSALIANAYYDLLGDLVVPVEAPDLLNAALAGAVEEALHEGVQTPAARLASGLDSTAALASFQQAFTTLVRRGGSKLNVDALTRAALTAMAEGVHDCHTAYLTKGQWDGVQADLAGQSSIPDLPLTFQLQAPYLVTSVISGSDAATQGVHPGDRVVAFDGVSPDQVPLSQRKFLPYGDPGSTAVLSLQAPDGGSRTVTLQRQEVQRPVIETHLDGDVGYIQLRTFTSGLNAGMDRALSTLRGRGAKGFVLDLRGNLGGELDSDAHLLSHFIGSGILAVVSRPGEAPDEVRADGSVLPGPPPLAVLVDGGSLSASELFAEDIKQYRAGRLVGTMTPGCLQASTFVPLRDGSALQVTADTVDVGPQHVVVNNVGIEPDDVVMITAADLAAGRDPQLDRALADVRAEMK